MKELSEKIDKLREKVPGIAIRTTVIVGFPGEDTDNFRRLASFVKNTEFERLGIFPYSCEEGTPAAVMPKPVKERTKMKRMGLVAEIQRKIHFRKQDALVGNTVEVMVDSQAETGEYIGRTAHDAYEVDAVVLFTSPGGKNYECGDLCQVTITASELYDLRGCAYEPTE